MQSSFPLAKNQQNKPNNWRTEPAETSLKQANNAVGSVTTSDDEESESQHKTSQKAATTTTNAANNRIGNNNNKNASNSNNRSTNRQHNSPSISSNQGLAATQPQPIPTSYYYNQNANPSSFVANQQLNEQPKLFSPSGSNGNISKRTDGLLSTSASSISNLEPSSDSNSQINIDTNQQEALAGGNDANLGRKFSFLNSSRAVILFKN